jgi:hypothetical protein
MTALCCLLTDATLVALAAAIGWVLVSGGGVYPVGRLRVGLRSVGNPLLFAYGLLLVRVWLGRAVPFLLVPRLAVPALQNQVLALLGAFVDRLRNMTGRQAFWMVMGGIGVTTLVKAANAIAYPGFYSGDDVEIHEMTFQQLFGLHYDVLNLRSPFFPMTFIYPVQRLLVALGVTETEPLVIAGRSVVVVASALAIWLLYRTAVKRLGSLALGVLAGILFAWSKLQVAFGSTELPRPVATLFVLLAFAMLLRRSRWGAVTAGTCLALAGSFRFSEFMFVLPAGASLLLDRRWRDLIAMAAACAATALLALGLGDAVYWGNAFHSLRNAIDFTLVEGLSTRAYQPFYYYVTSVSAWSNVVVVSFALYASRRRQWDLMLWAWVPVVVLSFFPHKEPRYLVPQGPFLAMLAAVGLRDVSNTIWEYAGTGDARRTRRAMWAATVFVVTLAAALVFEADGFRFERSRSGIAVAHRILAEGDGGVAVEQLWRAGGRLYLRRAEPFLNLEADDVRSANRLRAVCETPGVQWLAFRPRNLTADGQAAVAACRFELVLATDDGFPYHLYRRR